MTGGRRYGGGGTEARGRVAVSSFTSSISSFSFSSPSSSSSSFLVFILVRSGWDPGQDESLFRRHRASVRPAVRPPVLPVCRRRAVHVEGFGAASEAGFRRKFRFFRQRELPDGFQGSPAFPVVVALVIVIIVIQQTFEPKSGHFGPASAVQMDLSVSFHQMKPQFGRQVFAAAAYCSSSSSVVEEKEQRSTTLLADLNFHDIDGGADGG